MDSTSRAPQDREKDLAGNYGVKLGFAGMYGEPQGVEPTPDMQAQLQDGARKNPHNCRKMFEKLKFTGWGQWPS